jgi:lipopolysaccharide/colanic/teichoic acid biosynthesis glycosyltransferase
MLLLIAGAIFLEDFKNPLFKQPRLGYKGCVFNMYKFRSMKVNAPDLRSEDGATYNSKKDARVTRVGAFIRKTSLDELPQLINILKGQMSFIGPRPDLANQITLYHEEDKKRLEVLPGITGYAQAVGRNSLGFRERFKYDIEYVERCSLLFDIKILIMTVEVVLRRKHIHRH